MTSESTTGAEPSRSLFPDPSEAFRLPGLELEREVGRGAHSVVYRARRGGRAFAVKIQKTGVEDASGQAALRFRREGAILACLRHAGLPAILELGEVDGRPYLVQEFVTGRPLSALIAEGPLPVEAIISVARTIGGALSEVHRAGMVHCDVKPDNILVDAGGAARLIDFGFAVRAQRELDRDQVVGTLLYAPPEQTGMLKRPLDGRSDLYALGVVLYECAAGRTPFGAEDAGELIRQHAVTPAPDLREQREGVSPALAAIIHKLLAKDPDDRYQGRGGLLEDLDRLPELDAALWVGGEVELDRRADRDLLDLGLPLLGRDGEISRLSAHWNRALVGQGTVALVEGGAGMGKTRFVHELVERVRRGMGQALIGRCQGDSTLPFGPLRDALQGSLECFDELSEQARAQARQQLLEAAGDSAPLLKGFLPALGDALGDVPEAPGFAEVREQYYDAVAHFFLRYARSCGGLLLVLEDVHWLDEASKEVLTRLATLIQEGPLLLVLTATREPDSTPQLDELANDLGSALTLRQTLGPLDDRSLGRLVAAQLGDIEGEPAVAGRIAARSHGSPFMAIEYVRSVLDAGLLRPSWGAWLVDEDGLADLELATGVLDLVIRRLESLSDEAREVLQAGAVIGHRFDLDVLVAVCGDEERVQQSTAEGFLARVVEWGGTGSYEFVHQSVRRALLEGLSPERIRDLHQRVAVALEPAAGDTLDTERVYARARHYLAGDVGRDPQRVFDACLDAGRLALEDYAHEEAYAYLSQAAELSATHGIPCTPACHEALGEVSARTGRLAESIHHLEQNLETLETPLARAELRARLAYTHAANFHTGDAWREVEAGFRELRATLPRWSVWRVLSTGWHLLKARLGLVRRVTGPERRQWNEINARLCETGAIASFFANRPFRMLMMVLRSLVPAARLGISPARVSAFSQYAVAAAVGRRRSVAMRHILEAEDMARELGDRLTLARCQMYYGFVLHLCGSALEAEAKSRRCLEEHGQWLDALHYLDGSGDLVFNLFLRGYFRETWKWVERQLARLTFTSGGVRTRKANSWAGAVLASLGQVTEGLKYQEQTREFVEGAPPDEPFLRAEMLSYQVFFQIELGELGAALDETIAAHRTLGFNPLLTSFHMRSFFVFQAYARMEQAMRADPAERLPLVQRLAEAHRELKRAVMVPAMRAHQRLIRGALLRLQGRFRHARAMLDRADQAARDADSPWVLYEVARQRAHLLRESGKRAAALREARLALNLAEEHGWGPRARKIRMEFDLREASRRDPSSAPSLSVRETTSHTGGLRLKRQLEALMQVSLATARELDPDAQARKALDEIVRILGAERAFIFRTAREDEAGGDLVFQVGRDSERRDLDRPTTYSTTVVQRVRSRGKPVVVTGTEEAAVLGSESVVTHGLRSILGAPLRVRDELVGVIYLDNRLAGGVFTEDDLEILLALGNHIAVALETARAAQLKIRLEGEAQKRRLAESLRDMSHALSSTLNLDEVLERLLDGVTGVVAHQRAAVYLCEEEQLIRVLCRGADAPSTPDLVFGLGDDPLLAEVVASREAVVVRDTSRDPRVAHHREDEAPLASWLGVPLISKDRVAAVLSLEHRDAGAYSASEAEIAFSFAGQAGIAIENARLFGEVRRLATTDELTRVWNRRQFFALAQREVSGADRYERPISALMIDVDHFKVVNDTHGHAVGDQVLRTIARRCEDNVRDVDILGRYGGEEFAILLPDTPLAQARDVLAERLRGCIADAPIETSAGELTVTISVGVAAATKGIADLESLLDAADRGLYRAKAGGRNRVEVAPEGASGEGEEPG